MPCVYAEYAVCLITKYHQIGEMQTNTISERLMQRAHQIPQGANTLTNSISTLCVRARSDARFYSVHATESPCGHKARWNAAGTCLSDMATLAVSGIRSCRERQICCDRGRIRFFRPWLQHELSVCRQHTALASACCNSSYRRGNLSGMTLGFPERRRKKWRSLSQCPECEEVRWEDGTLPVNGAQLARRLRTLDGEAMCIMQALQISSRIRAPLAVQASPCRLW